MYCYFHLTFIATGRSVESKLSFPKTPLHAKHSTHFYKLTGTETWPKYSTTEELNTADTHKTSSNSSKTDLREKPHEGFVKAGAGANNMYMQKWVQGSVLLHSRQWYAGAITVNAHVECAVCVWRRVDVCVREGKLKRQEAGQQCCFQLACQSFQGGRTLQAATQRRGWTRRETGPLCAGDSSSLAEAHLFLLSSYGETLFVCQQQTVLGWRCVCVSALSGGMWGHTPAAADLMPFSSYWITVFMRHFMLFRSSSPIMRWPSKYMVTSAPAEAQYQIL